MKKYKYRPVLFFVLAYLFTWMFWIPAVFVPENIGIILMLIGLIAPAVISTIFVLASDSETLKNYSICCDYSRINTSFAFIWPVY